MTDKIQGRPTDYSLELAERICQVLCASDATVTDVCAPADMPNRSTVFRWLAKYPEFRDLYVRAREFQSELLYDDMAEIANAPFEEVPVFDLLGNQLGVKVDAGAAMAEMQRRKLQIDVIKFKLVKLQARRFGDNRSMDLNVKVNHNVSSEQYKQLLETAKAAPRIEAPEAYTDFEELADRVTDFDGLDDDTEDDGLG